MNHPIPTIMALVLAPLFALEGVRLLRVPVGSGPRLFVNPAYRIKPGRERLGAGTVFLGAALSIAMAISDLTTGEIDPISYLLAVPVVLGFWSGERVDKGETPIRGRWAGLTRVVLASLAVVVGLGLMVSPFVRVEGENMHVPAAFGAALAAGVPTFLARPSRRSLLIALGVALVAGLIFGWLVARAIGG